MAAPVATADRRVAALGRSWEAGVSRTVERWRAEAEPAISAHIAKRIEIAVQIDAPGDIATIEVPPSAGEIDLLTAAARQMAGLAQASVLGEARAAGCDLPAPPAVASVGLADWASAAAQLLASGLALGMAREALRVWRPGRPAAAVAEDAQTYARGLTARGVRDVVGGLLTRAQNLGVISVYAAPLPPRWRVRLYADETLDTNTCGPCRAIDGEELPSPEAAALAYGGAGYLYCEGRERCRGTVRGEWIRDEPADVAQLLSDIVAGRHYKRDRKGRFSETDEARLKRAVKAAKAFPFDDEEHWRRLTGGQSGAGVQLAMPDGSTRVVRKQFPDWDEPEQRVDAEVSVCKVGNALDVSIALVQPENAKTVWVEHAPGITHAVAKYEQPDQLDRYEQFYASNAGKRMGLLDVLTTNNDRNSGNLIIGDAEVIGIDHAFAFAMFGYGRDDDAVDPNDLGNMGGEQAPARHYIDRVDEHDDGNYHSVWRDNPLTPGDVIETRARLQTLGAHFEAIGHLDWYTAMFAVLAELEDHATGTESIYDD